MSLLNVQAFILFFTFMASFENVSVFFFNALKPYNVFELQLMFMLVYTYNMYKATALTIVVVLKKISISWWCMGLNRALIILTTIITLE